MKRLPEETAKNDPNIKYPYAFILKAAWDLSAPGFMSGKRISGQVAQMTYRFIEDTAQGYLNMQK